MKRFLDYNKKLKERSKKLQREMTKPEKKLRFEFFKKLSEIPPTPLNKGDLDGSKKSNVVSDIPYSKEDLIELSENNLDKSNIFSNIPLTKGVAESRGIRIYKQRPIENFIVDFYIPKLKLVIEVDGDSHFDEQGLVYDEERTQILQGLGLKVIRFTNEEVIENFSGVCEILKKEIGIN